MSLLHKINSKIKENRKNFKRKQIDTLTHTTQHTRRLEIQICCFILLQSISVKNLSIKLIRLRFFHEFIKFLLFNEIYCLETATTNFPLSLSLLFLSPVSSRRLSFVDVQISCKIIFRLDFLEQIRLFIFPPRMTQQQQCSLSTRHSSPRNDYSNFCNSFNMSVRV